MNRIDRNSTGPGHLADLLAELLQQFRHFYGSPETAPGMASHLARLKVSARLLTLLPGPAGPKDDGFARLGGVLGEWCSSYESSPESFPLHVCGPLERLAGYLEEILAAGDRGVPVPVLAADDGWKSSVTSFRSAGTPLAILEEVDGQLRKWEHRWNVDNLTPVQEKELYHRWLALRKKGDALFRAGAGPRSGAGEFSGFGGEARLVLLLVDSSFRRDQITEKLHGHDYRVEIAGDPAEALEMLAAGMEPRVIACDNLEPTRHLAGIRDGLAAAPAFRTVPLVLVVGGAGTDQAGLRRARSLGAAGAWREPYDPADFHRILQRLSQP
jgi:CheY-like chemotaxis protein